MSQTLNDSNALERLMEKHLFEVFAQRDSERRKVAIGEVYAEDFRFFEAEGPVVVGRDALNKRVENLLGGAPGFAFRAGGPAQVIHDHGRLQWQFGPPGAAAVVTGMDVAIFEQGRIRALYTFLDNPPSE